MKMMERPNYFARKLKALNLLLLSIASLSIEAQAQFFEIVSDSTSPVQIQALLDARAYIAKVEGKIPEIKKSKDWSKEGAIISGIANENPLLKAYAGKVAQIKNDGFIIDKANIGGANCIVVAAATNEGVANGIYELLRQLGFGFSLGTEFVPAKLSAGNVRQSISSPALPTRGFLPWHNFYNSPTVWDYVDFRAFIDDAARIGANFIGFHNYEGEPIIAHYDKSGKLVAGGRLFSTKSPNWGTHPTKSEDFGFGTDKVYSQEYFGAKTTEIADDKDALEAEQKIIADALAYAKSRGIKTAIGFDPTFYAGTPIPMTESVLVKFINRLKFLVERYPSVDYIWIWPCEASAVSGILAPSGTLSETRALANYARDAMEDFEEIAKFDKTNHPWLKKTPQGALERVSMGVAYEHLARAALRVFAQYKNPPKLIISGWGGDENLLTEVYFSGWCKRLPKDLVSYSALEHFFPKPRTSASYHNLPKDCVRWPIPWLENDGDQWQPRPFVKTYEGFMNSLFESGSQGVLGIHWRTRCVGENFQYLCDRAWNKNLTRQEFYKNYARRLYGDENLAETSAIHDALDMLPDRWVNGSGQGEAAKFSWGTLGSEQELQALLDIQKKVEQIQFKNPYAKANWRWLKDRINWVLNYRTMTQKALLAQELIKQSNYAEALNVLSDKAFADAFRSYVMRLSTRGEYGVLATANSKAYYDWKKMYDICLEKLNQDKAPPHRDWKVENKDARIILPRHFASLEKGQDLEVEPIVLGGGKANMFFRALGAKEWQRLELKNLKGWVYTAKVPADKLGEVGVEFKFGFDENPNNPNNTQCYTAVIMPGLESYSRPKIAQSGAPKGSFRAQTFKRGDFPIAIKWEKVKGCEYYRVIRDGEVQSVSGVEYFFDASNKPKGEYVIEAVKDGEVLAKSNPVPYTMPNISISEVPSAEFTESNAGVLIKVAPPKEQNSSYCIIYRSGKLLKSQTLGSNVFEHIDQKQNLKKGETVVAELPTDSASSCVFFDEVPEGDWNYRIAFANQFKSEAKDSLKHSVKLRRAKMEIPLNLSLQKKPEGTQIFGDVSFGANGANTSKGYFTIDNAEIKDFDRGYAVSFSFKPEEVKDGAVIISCGAFPNKGWYLQCGKGTFALMGDNDAGLGLPCGEVQADKWYEFEFQYDGANAIVKVNGKTIHKTRLKRPLNSPKDCPLVIGNYTAAQEQYHFKGEIKNLKIAIGAKRK